MILPVSLQNRCHRCGRGGAPSAVRVSPAAAAAAASATLPLWIWLLLLMSLPSWLLQMLLVPAAKATIVAVAAANPVNP